MPNGRKVGFREVEQRIHYLSLPFQRLGKGWGKAGERLQKASLLLSENGSAFQGTPVFLQNFTVKVIVFRGGLRKDGFGADGISVSFFTASNSSISTNFVNG